MVCIPHDAIGAFADDIEDLVAVADDEGGESVVDHRSGGGTVICADLREYYTESGLGCFFSVDHDGRTRHRRRPQRQVLEE